MTRSPGGTSRPVVLVRELRERLLDHHHRSPLSPEILALVDRLEATVALLGRVAEGSFEGYEAQLRDLSLIRRVGELLNACFDVEALSRALARVLVEQLACDAAQIELGTPDEDRPSLCVRWGELAAEIPTDLASRLREEALARGRAVVRPDLALERSADAPTRLRSIAVLPCSSLPLARATILLGDARPHSFPRERLAALHPVAELVSIALRHALLVRGIVEERDGLQDRVRVQLRELDETRLALMRRERLAALGQLAASIAHEINNPMSFVLSNLHTACEYLKDVRSRLDPWLDVSPGADLQRSASECNPTPPPSPQRPALADPTSLRVALDELEEILGEVLEGLERIRAVAHELKGFGASGELRTAPADLNRMVETAVRIAEAQSKGEVRFVRDYGEVPAVPCRRYQLIQVVLNLLLNAVEAMRGSGTVWVQTRAQGGVAVVSVEDEGPGVPPELQERIFAPFFTTKPGRGSGLGLAISRDLVRAHGGSLELAPARTGGARFTVRLPLRPPFRRSEPAPSSEAGPGRA